MGLVLNLDLLLVLTVCLSVLLLSFCYSDSSRLAQYHSNKDAEPTKVYYLGASTVIVSVDAQGNSSGDPRSVIAAGGNGVSAERAQSASSVLRDSSSASSKFYFQLHFSPRQNDESSLLLYAGTARERAEWLKILWLSGCEYPSLGKNPNAPGGANANHQGGAAGSHTAGGHSDFSRSVSSSSSDPLHAVTPGARPSPIHPSVLAPPGSHTMVGVQAFMSGGGGGGLHSPGGGAGEGGDSDESSDGDEYEEELPLAEEDIEPGSQPTGEDDGTDTFAEQPNYPPLSDRRSTPTGDLAGWQTSPGAGGRGLTPSLSFSTARGLTPSSSFYGGFSTPSSRRRLSLAEKKHESDLHGIFSLRRAKFRLALGNSWTALHAWRQKNLATERARLTADASESGHTRPVFEMMSNGPGGNSTGADGAMDGGVTGGMDGLDLGWMEMLVPRDSEVIEPSSSATAAPTEAIPMSPSSAVTEDASRSPQPHRTTTVMPPVPVALVPAQVLQRRTIPTSTIHQMKWTSWSWRMRIRS